MCTRTVLKHFRSPRYSSLLIDDSRSILSEGRVWDLRAELLGVGGVRHVSNGLRGHVVPAVNF